MGRRSRAKPERRQHLVSARLPHRYGDDGPGHWQITFPSGRRFKLSGNLWVGRLPDGVIAPPPSSPGRPAPAARRPGGRADGPVP
jgi:hypothetical protein